MKRAALLVSLLLLIVSFAGCAGQTANTDTKQTAEPKATEAVTTKEAKLNFPTKNIKIIVPFDPGGGTDILARVFAEAAGKEYFDGYSLVVENMGGGGGVIGQTYVAKSAEPDGYTVMLFTSSVINNTILKEVTFSYKDFKPLCIVNPDQEIVTVPKDSPFNTIDDIVKAAKTREVMVSTPGHSSGHHIRAMNFADKQGLKFKYLHNDSAAIQLQQLMGGHTEVAFMTVGEASGAIKDGTIKGIAVMDKERVKGLDQIPTFAEEGYEGWIDGAFRGFACSKDVPDDVYNYLIGKFKEVAESEKFIEGMKKVNLTPGYSTPEEQQAYIDFTAEGITKLKPILLQK